MPRYRKLHVKTIESLDFHELPDDFTRLLWVLLPLGVDAEGRGIMSCAWIRAKLFPLRSDISDEKIKNAMLLFEQHDMIVRYKKSGRAGVYFSIVNWHEYQGDTSRESQSHLPSPNDDDVELVTTKSGVNHELVTNKSSLDSNTDSNTDSINAISPNEIDVVEKSNNDVDARNELLMSNTTAGKIVMNGLSGAAESKGRRGVKYYANAQQRDAYLEVFKILGDELPSLVDAGIERERMARATLLVFLQKCAKNRQAKENDKRIRERHAMALEQKRQKENEEILKQLEDENG